MIPVPSGVRVYLATGVTDMRRGMNTLALQVQESLGRDPHGGDLFIFRGRRGDLVKCLWHDGIGGVALHQAPGAGPIRVAVDGGRGGVDQRRTAWLPARGDQIGATRCGLGALCERVEFRVERLNPLRAGELPGRWRSVSLRAVGAVTRALGQRCDGVDKRR